MKKALVCAHVASMVQQFNMENIRLLLEQGYEVDVACNMERPGSITPEKAKEMERQLAGMGVRVIHIPAPKKVTAVKGILQSFGILRKRMKENNYALIHCHSPIGGMVCRVANLFGGNYRKTRMLYTAHGFHFYQGAPLKNWLLYYPVEWLCSRFTDVLITINREDYALACKRMCAKKTVYVPGVGVDTAKAANVCVDRNEKLAQLEIPEDAVVIFSVGELNHNKNHRVIIQAMAKLDDRKVHYVIAGRGDGGEVLRECAQKNGVEERLHVLGYRSDVPELMAIADVYAFPSYREGLPVSMMEAMAAGKAVVCSNIRGNTDLMSDGVGGFLLDPDDMDGFARALQTLLQDHAQRAQMGAHNQQIMQKFDRKVVEKTMQELYGGMCGQAE